MNKRYTSTIAPLCILANGGGGLEPLVQNAINTLKTIMLTPHGKEALEELYNLYDRENPDVRILSDKAFKLLSNEGLFPAHAADTAPLASLTETEQKTIKSALQLIDDKITVVDLYERNESEAAFRS